MRSLFDDTFNGVHHLELFDWALLIPYFAILIVLSFYGCHRLEMIRKYMKHRRDMAHRLTPWRCQLPRVTIQLPLYNERYVVERLLEEACQMEYPRNCCRSRFWTIPPTIRIRSPKHWCASIRLPECRSSICIATIERDSKRALCRRACRPRPAS